MDAPALVLKYWTELRACLAAEVAAWERLSAKDGLARLRPDGSVYSVGFGDVRYGIVASLLEESDTNLHVMLEVQPEDVERFAMMASPRSANGGGWANNEMALVSEDFF
jgi:hypothetical protein